jgi:AcrR family transcriptional regulator
VDRDGPKQKMLDATLSLLSKEGFHAITTRRVAREAGVNVAAVNYHFGSKETLVTEAAKLFKEKTRALFTVLHDDRLPTSERLVRLVHGFAEHIIAYPGFLRTFVAAIVRGEDPPAPARVSIIQARELMFHYLTDVLDDDEEHVRNAMLQLMSAIVYPAIIGDHVHDLYQIPFGDPEYRWRYIDQLVATFGLKE